MEEEKREQPLEEPATVSGETIDDRAVSENGSLNCEGNLNPIAEEIEQKDQEDLNLGKFKSVQALLDAYNSLQVSFTKKCQRLSELEKDKTESITSFENDQNSIDKEVDKFLSKNAEAKEFADELKQRAIAFSKQNDSLNVVENAWNSIITDSIKSHSNLEQNKIMDKYVLSDEMIRNKIIQEYLNSLNKSAPPKVISSGQGRRVSDVTNGTPSSLSEAKSLMEKMFN